MSSANSDSFTSFPIWILFLSFSSVVAMARTSKTMVNNHGKSGHLYLVSDLRENALFFTTENDFGCGFVIHGLYCVEVGSLCAHVLESFCHVWVLNFVKSFFYIS